MFDIVSHLSSHASGSLPSTAVRDPASASLYDQILRSVLQSLHIAEQPTEAPAVQADEAAPSLHNRTLEDVLQQRRVSCSLHDASQPLPLEQIALYQESLSGHGESPVSLQSLREELAPWELLMGQMTFQQRLAS